jgi:hypothetical protein
MWYFLNKMRNAAQVLFEENTKRRGDNVRTREGKKFGRG